MEDMQTKNGEEGERRERGEQGEAVALFIINN
jgi:hypothetical protein